MKAEIVAPFIKEMAKIFKKELAIACQKKNVSLQYSPVTWHEVNVLIGVKGAVEATVVYGMEENTACALASAFCKNRSFENKAFCSYCSEVEDSLKELFNIVSGHALKTLETMGLACTRPEPPCVIIGRLHHVPLKGWPQLAVLIDTPAGEIRLSVSMTNNAGQ